MSLAKIDTAGGNRISQLLPGQGENQVARASDVNKVIDVVNGLSAGVETGPIVISDTTQSTTAATGSLITAGGAGIAKDVFITGATNIAGGIVSSGTTDSTTSTTGDVKTAGGLGVAKAAFIGTTLNNATAANLATASGTTTIGATTSATISTAGVLTVANATDSSSSTTGSTIITGGVGVAKKAFIGTALDVGTTSNLQGAVTHGAINIYKTTIGMTATAGGAQAGTALASELNVFGTVTTAADSAQLPVAVLGKKVIVRNDAAKSMAVFGQTGDAIDGAAANASFALQPGQEIIFEAQSGTTWTTLQGTSLGTISSVTQATSITTGVTVNSKKGIITTFTPSTAGLGATTFTVTCNKTTATSNIRAYVTEYGGTVLTNGLPYIFVRNQTATAFDIIVYNAHATNALATSMKIGFEIIN